MPPSTPSGLQSMTGAFGIWIIFLFMSLCCLLIELAYKSYHGDNHDQSIQFNDTDYLLVNISCRIPRRKNEINCDLICQLCKELKELMDDCTSSTDLVANKSQ
jgi:hypothetical protein